MGCVVFAAMNEKNNKWLHNTINLHPSCRAMTTQSIPSSAPLPIFCIHPLPLHSLPHDIRSLQPMPLHNLLRAFIKLIPPQRRPYRGKVIFSLETPQFEVVPFQGSIPCCQCLLRDFRVDRCRLLENEKTVAMVWDTLLYVRG